MGLANYDLPDDLLNQVIKSSGAKTKKEAIIISLKDYLRHQKIKELLAARGKISLSWTQKELKKFRE